jgi:thymidylate kinase
MAKVIEPRGARTWGATAPARSTHADSNGHAGGNGNGHAAPDDQKARHGVAAQAEPAAIPLVARLCEELRREGVGYCQFKSNWQLARWLAGEGDLDLLVARADAAPFACALARLGFKQARPTGDRVLPGVVDYYGFDAAASRFVHLHVHYQLVLGHDLTKNFRLPLEGAYLESASHSGVIPVPAAEFELILFVLRMTLKYGAAESALRRLAGGRSAASDAVRGELEFLEARSDAGRVRAILRKHLPFVGVEFFDELASALRGTRPAWRRVALRLRLERRLRAHARRGLAADACVKASRRVRRFVFERAARRPARKRLASGGALVALVGGDGAGKTTAVKGLHGWLSKKFVVRRFHLGKPPRSPLTLAVIVLLHLRARLPGAAPVVRPAARGAGGGAGARGFPGYLRLLRWVLAARDRRRLYTRARRFATNGGIALCDRFPVRRLRMMDGPNIARTVEPARMNRAVRALLRAEERNYQRIMEPDLLVVLRVDPEVAVRRKTTESEEHVRARSRELWEQDWSGTRAHVVDAGRPAAEVAAELRSIVWRNV